MAVINTRVMTLAKPIVRLSLCAVLFVSLGAGCGKKDDSKDKGSSAGTKPAAAADAAPAPAPKPVPPVDAASAAAPVADAAAAVASAASLTPELKAFDDMVAPILAMTDQDARTKAACKALFELRGKLRIVGDKPPAGADPTAWRDLAESISGGLEEFAIECGEGSAFNTKALAEAAERTKEFQELVAKKPD
jgi:hypothetical protein